jgi:HSP20 family molecular chaperone IbpA
MTDQSQSTERAGAVTRYEYEDAVVLAADLGASAGEGSVDIVDGTAIVVVGDRQREFPVPEGAAKASINNGVVTVEVER